MVRTVLVTGAGSGTGTALPTAPLGARVGARVVGTARPDDRAYVAARAVGRAGAAVEPVAPDVTDAAMSAAGSREAAPVG
ncbi:MAG TPA: hypothetical protein VM242_03165 [Acidimicrobiales bacterium]|jgi:NADP-dependent 3-hydroxy acid dehydrogenase YdfG|nr:hypothetical protein [Acidimicrobiales bacterium]